MKELKLAALLTCGLILCACSPGLPASRAASTPTALAAANSAPILIGGAMCLTGPIAFADVPALQGVELAVAEVNKAGGVLGRQLE
ncbi:MAG TPA: ABC transporter substrate-binding protein, partial [Anaerolineaceae bacterium]